MNSTAEKEVKALREAIHCLYIAVDESIANDVRRKAEAVISAYESVAATLEKVNEPIWDARNSVE